MDRNAQIQEILDKKLTWQQLTPEQQALFGSQEEFESLISIFETGSTIDAALLESLVNQMNQELDLKNSLPDYSADQRALIEKLVKIRIEQIHLEQIQKNKQALEQVKPEVDKLNPKTDPRQEITRLAHQVIGSSNKPAIKKFIEICLTSDLDLSKPQDLDLAVSIALGKNELYQQVEGSVVPATDQDYIQAISDLDSHDSSRIIISNDIVLDTQKLPPPNQISSTSTPNTRLNDDLNDALAVEITKLKTIENSPQAQEISNKLTTQISDQQLDQLTHTINQLDPTLLQLATSAGQEAAAILQQIKAKTPGLSPHAVLAYSQGLRPETWAEIYQNAKIQNLVSPQQAYQIHQQLKFLDNSNLGKEITQPLTQASRTFQTLTNRLSSRLPSSFFKPLNYFLHPVQSLKGWFGRQIGKRLGAKIYKAFAKKITNKTARLIAKTLLRQGIKEGVKFLVKQGLKRSLQLAAQALNIAPGLGLVAAAVIEVGSFLWQKTVGAIQNLAQSIWGEKIKARDLLALPAAGLAAGISAFSALGGATVAAAGSAGATIVISAVAGIFIYITAFAVAPLISTIAHLESQPGLEYNITTPSGPVPPGCPSIWPTISGYITQGPKTLSTHYNLEAIDIGVPTGTPILTTHPGRAIAYGSSGPYGNYVDVFGVCNGISYITRYGHMPFVPFSGEKLVNTGDQIGVANDTGNSTGPHLHYEIRANALGDINQFLPKPVAPGCIGAVNCNITIP